MSHSAFRILANDEPINRNLVIVVNKNGQVSTDTEVLQTLLTTKGDANTGISILRETSPTPSISDEIEQERMEKIEVKRQEYLQEHEGEEIDEEELEKQMQQITGAIESGIPHVTLNVENFYPSDQARKFANDVLHLGGIENPSSLMPIDFNFQRQTIQNDHCYTSFLQNTPEAQKPSKSSQDSKSSQGKASKRDLKPTAKVREMQGDAESSDDEEGGLEDDEEYEEEQSGEEISFSESDDDNDMDFSVNDRFGKKGKKKRKYRKHKQKNSTFKDFLETGEVADINDEGKKKFGKSPKKQPKVPKPVKNTQVKKAPVRTQFVPLTNFKTQQISITATSTPIKTKQEIEFVESIVKDLEKSFPEADSSKKLAPIPTIIQMMDTSTSAEVIDQSLANLEQLDAVPGIDEIGDALIAVLGNDAIDELFNQDGLMNFSEPLVTSSTPTSTVPVVSEAASSSLVMPKILNKQAPVKDPIKVVRNGRVITLPAIEAPATRGAKRRAQGDSPNTSISEKVIKTEKSDNDSKNSSRRSSVSGKSSRRQSVAAVADELDDLISDASWASEDDPDRLWCICKQPHNNRFMICCDKCEDWFHGKCVNVTKAMGKEYELMGKEWRCPNCKADPGKKIDPNKKPLNQQKLTKFFAKSQKESTDEDVAKTMCVVCKSKAARDSSIYCSDECIQNHATKHIDSDGSTVKPKEETEKRGNILKDKSGNVIVFDRTTGKILSLHKSPHFTKLAQWLAQNPNFEPVKPGSPQARQLLNRNKSQSQPSTPSTPVPETPSTPTTPAPKPAQSGDDLFSNPVKINTGATPPVVKKPTTPTTTVPVRPTVKPTKSPSVTPSAPVKSSSKLPEKKPVKKEERSSSGSSGSSVKVKAEQERQNVRNILRDTLKARMSEFDHPDIPKMTDDQIADFAKEIEREMFLFFNKDTRDKYKTKYRSLKFNLSDVKNKTLLEKICARKLTPKQLVELPASALASEELSKWRETENKHTLEIITKSELDALAQNKIVVKTHKGEEIIETKTASADILVPVDDVESVIAKTVLSVDGRYDLSRSISMNTSTNSPLSSPTVQSTSKKTDKDHHHHHHKSSSSKHKRHRSRSPKHHHKDRKSRDRSRSKHRREKSKEIKREEKKEVKKDSKEKEVKKTPTKPVDIQPDQQDVDLVGKILDSMGVHLEKPKEVPEVPPPPPVTSTEPINEHKLPIEIFSGNIHMIDVANFNVTASIVSGNFDDIISVIPSNLDCVGRIEPNTVWDYLEKVKKFPGKELCILRFASDDESGYFNFFTYLHTRQRYGVIKTGSPKIKDFYLVPIEASRPLPKVLLPICGPGFIEGEEHKPDLLLGVMLKILPEVKTKKPQVQQKKVSKPSTSTRPPVVIEHPIHVIPKKSSKLTMGLPEFSKTGELQTSSKKSPFEETDDGDEPYTPFDDDEEFPASTSAVAKPTASEDLESQMELINREIEQRQMEMQSLAQQKAMEINEEQASRIYENISVPANLSEILSTISSRDSKPMEIDDGDDEEEYVPAPMAGYTASSYSATQPVPIANAMMDIDERIAMFPAAPPAPIITDDQPSRLSNMTTADLMKLVPDDAFEAPPAPKISGSVIPGLDNDDDFEMN